MGLFDFLFKNKKEEQKRLERERLAELQRREDEHIAENRRREAERKAKIERERLEMMAAELSKDFPSPIYVEDKYSDFIRNTSFNPFKLTTDPILNSNLEFGNLVAIFKSELEDLLSKVVDLGLPIDYMICGYIFNMIESYYNNAGYVPKAAADSIIEQVYSAIKQTKYSGHINSLDQLKYTMYWNLTHK